MSADVAGGNLSEDPNRGKKSSAAKPRDEKKPAGFVSYGEIHPFAKALAVEGLPDLRPLLPRLLRRQVLHGDELAGHERPPPRHPRRAQPGLGGDAVLVLAEDRLQLGGGAGKRRRALADHRGHGFRRIPGTLGENADSMQL